MKPKLIVIFLLLVCLPLVMLAWLGLRLAREEQAGARRRFTELLAGKLKDIDAHIGRFLERRERELLSLTEFESLDPEKIRARVRKNPIVSQIFVLDEKGKLLHPAPAGSLNRGEQEFLRRTRHIWEGGERFASPAEPAQPRSGVGQSRKASSARSSPELSPANKPSGWYGWFHNQGLHLIYWQRNPAGRIIGAELARMRLLADIVSALPSAEEANLPRGRIRLLDAKGKPVYEWGGYEPSRDEKPRLRLPLRRPLNAWGLAYFVPETDHAQALQGSALFNLVTGLAGVGLALVGLAVYFYRENTRQMREAEQRVSFVNQVSHELKTPLTNVRMYAELLERDLPDDAVKSRGHLGVIVSESQRLSRLIANVLTFGQEQRGELRLASGIVDDTIRQVLDHFRPALEAKNVEIVFAAGAGDRVMFDADALEQILGNLFSNVEKYAVAGKWLRVESRQSGDTTSIRVSDRGPGVPVARREDIFRPFVRVSDKLTDGVSGTGIGLSIARELARLHGGDLKLTPPVSGSELRVQGALNAELRTPNSSSEMGARFEVRLRTPREEEKKA